MNSLDLNFNLNELIAIIGLAQVVFVLVFIAGRIQHVKQAILPLSFFSVLLGAFFLSAAETRFHPEIANYETFKWLAWIALAPLSVLLIVQIAKIVGAPQKRFLAIFLLIPLAYLGVSTLGRVYDNMPFWFHISSIAVGSVSLLSLWRVRDLFRDLSFRRNGRERYWLIISLIVLNIMLLVVNLLFVYEKIQPSSVEMIRNIIGISFIYIVSTSLFRIYPQSGAVKLDISPEEKSPLSDEELKIALKIENLLYLDKVYQESNYKRADLARELSISESYLSKIVNHYFEKSVPQLLNTYRVEDSKYLLKETSMEVSAISEEAGFNSIATFNRVFKELSGYSPSNFREIRK